jgi:TIR domain-containing protein
VETSGEPSVFISYSRRDKRWREKFRGHLESTLKGRAHVWCDEDIGPGTKWQDVLSDELDRADVALVLASSEYLQSDWCRKELSHLCIKYREKRLQNVFWLQLRPCAWQQSELEAFQGPRALSAEKAIGDITNKGKRERLILAIAGEISAAVEQLERARNPSLTHVKALLGQEARKRNISIESMISSEGDFAHVSRGRDGSQRDVAIKIVPRWRVVRSFERLAKAAEQRRQLRDPGFIRLYDSFRVGGSYDEHLVLIMEFFEAKRLQVAMDAEPGRRFGIDRTVTLLRRAAETLCELHRTETEDGMGDRDFGFGPMIPHHVFYDERLKRVRFSALSVSTIAREVPGWQVFSTVHDPSSAPYKPPEIGAREPTKLDKHRVDQFMLGRLALDMLAAEQGWRRVNPQLDRIVAKMLAPDPQARWASMEEIATQLRAVEDEPRALAKASYMKWIEGDAKFFEEFYERFFASMEAKGVDSRAKFQDREQQQEKLRKGMAAVLNFHTGNEPTSMRYVSDVHRRIGVTAAELDQFAATFMALLKDRLDQRMTPDEEMAGRKEEILQAWHELLSQVLDYFRDQGVRARRAHITRRAPSPAPASGAGRRTRRRRSAPRGRSRAGRR